MPRHNAGPFPADTTFPDFPGVMLPDVVVEARVESVRRALVSAGLLPVGTAAETVRDVGWERDLHNLVLRSHRHAIRNADGSESIVSVRLHTLVAEVDDNNEICCWLYEES